MSSLLYELGRLCFQRSRRVVAIWLAVFVATGVAGGLLGTGTRDVFRSGDESFIALDRLGHVFPEVSGAAGQVLVVADEGVKVDSPENKARIEAVAKQFEEVPQVAMVISPWSDLVETKDTINKDASAALIQVGMKITVEQIKPDVKAAYEKVAEDATGDGLTFHAGGGVYGPEPPVISPVEGIGMVVALIVLFITFGSLIAAGLPLVIAMIAIGIAMSIVWASTRWLDIGSSGPMLALMIGLAVGIDYTLFILARYRDERSNGIEPEDATGRAVATAGSAVIFAGVTVIIALLGLVVTQLTFLTLMGIGAAIAVAVAILASITLTPAMFAILGDRVDPKQPKAPKQSKKPAKPKKERVGLNERWLNLVLRFPKFFTVAVSAVLVLMSIPALHMQLTLPDNGTAREGLPQRTTYELVSEKFGEGFNGQLVMTADIVQSTEPLEAIADIKKEILKDPGVASVPIATPNPPNADTMLIQIVPTTGPNDPETHELIDRLRDLGPEIEKKWGFEIALTGITAATGDLTKRLALALIPYGILVLGLSLVLFTMVFRSIAVPIKATFNFILSVCATFGAVVWVYQDGHLEHLLHTVAVSPLICFLPIMLVSLLFGLSMDYEVFLVSRIREEYVHGKSAIEAIRTGYLSSSKVITAAAVIMIAVFAAFVPHGDVSIQPMSFALAVGVFIDAFMVRITLVPAVMAVLGDKAWWMPAWLDKWLPVVDVEGEGVTHQLKLLDWPAPDAHDGVHAERMVVHDRDGNTIVGPVSFEIAPGELTLATGLAATSRTGLAFGLTGRMRTMEGNVKVAGHVVPEQMILVRKHVALVVADEHADPVAALKSEVSDQTRVVVIDGLDRIPSSLYREHLLDTVRELITSQRVAALVTVSRDGLSHLTTVDPEIRVLDLSSNIVAPFGAHLTEGSLA